MMLWAAAIAITASFYEQDPQLRRYTLDPEPEIKVIVLRDEPPVGEPSLTWRAFGWATYLACGGAVPISTQYRDQRSQWDPPVAGVPLTTATFIGISLASNMGSEKMRRNRVETLDWATRVVTLGACAWTAGWNFNRGWKRE